MISGEMPGGNVWPNAGHALSNRSSVNNRFMLDPSVGVLPLAPSQAPNTTILTRLWLESTVLLDLADPLTFELQVPKLKESGLV